MCHLYWCYLFEILTQCSVFEQKSNFYCLEKFQWARLETNNNQEEGKTRGNKWYPGENIIFVTLPQYWSNTIYLNGIFKQQLSTEIILFLWQNTNRLTDSQVSYKNALLYFQRKRNIATELAISKSVINITGNVVI